MSNDSDDLQSMQGGGGPDLPGLVQGESDDDTGLSFRCTSMYINVHALDDDSDDDTGSEGDNDSVTDFDSGITFRCTSMSIDYVSKVMKNIIDLNKWAMAPECMAKHQKTLLKVLYMQGNWT